MSGAKTSTAPGLPRRGPGFPRLELLPESETHAPFAHCLRVVVLPSATADAKARVRVFCTHCGRAMYDEEWFRECEPEIPTVQTRLSDGRQWGAK